MSKTLHASYKFEIAIECEESIFVDGDPVYIPSINLPCTTGFVKLEACDSHGEAYKMALETLASWGK